MAQACKIRWQRYARIVPYQSVEERMDRLEVLVTLVEAFGFRLDRISGSHHIFVHPEIPELLNGRTGSASEIRVSPGHA